jgi:hypothetical protein
VHSATINFLTSTLRSGTAARKFFEAKAGPSGPCGRPGGSVWSVKFGEIASLSEASSPVFQNW